MSKWIDKELFDDFQKEKIEEKDNEGGQRGANIWPTPEKNKMTSILSALDERPPDAKPLSDRVRACLAVWQDFIKKYPSDIELPSFPIWSMEFGADYPYESTTPFAVGLRKLNKYRGTHGCSLRELSPSERILGLPSYARREENTFPRWKVRFITQNRELYKNKY